MLPKITRRLRDDERKLITSGTIFVFDEVESSIKRWTDGMIWSPSRILNNFLVYREVEKKDPKPASDQPPFATSHSGFAMQNGGGGNSHAAQHASVRSVPLTLMPNAMDADGQMMHYKQEHGGYRAFDGLSSSSGPVYADQDGFLGAHPHQPHPAHSSTHPQAAGLVGLIDDGAASTSAAKREAAELDRTIVGSLTTSYPFVRDGLCKKTISIQVEGSTQHLISYYKIDDVHHGRLAIPSNLPEISSLSISPMFLNKSNFRYPPIVEIGADGLPRYVGESTDNAMRASGHVSSGNESYSSGSEARHDGLGRAASRSLSIYSPALPSDAGQSELYSNRYPHQIGGDGMLPSSATLPSSSTSSLPYRSRRSSDAPRRRANSRYEPYQSASVFGHGIVSTQLYSNAPAMDHGPVSPSGRRAFFGSSRGYGEMDPMHTSEHASFGLQRPDAGLFAIGPISHAGAQNGAQHTGHSMDQQHAPIEHVDQHGDLQQSFQAGSMMPIVPSQPGRGHAGYSTGADFMHARSDLALKQEPADPFHFSSRLTRGSWDSNQPSHSNSFVHHVQQPPATSQGLTAIPVHSHSNFGVPVYGRLAGSPPNTSSSHDSRHSYFGSGATQATGRIEELVDGVHPPTATRLEDANYSSRPMSRAGEGGYAGDLDSAGMVRTGALEALQVHSDPASPYPRSHHHHVQHAQQPMLGTEASGFDGYGRPAVEVEGPQQSFYAQHSSHPAPDHDGVQLDQQAFGRHAQDGYASTHVYPSNEMGSASAHNEQAWSSEAAPQDNGATDTNQQLSSRPGTSHDQGYHHQYRSEDANATDDSGLEKVMLTRPAS